MTGEPERSLSFWEMFNTLNQLFAPDIPEDYETPGPPGATVWFHVDRAEGAEDENDPEDVLWSPSNGEVWWDEHPILLAISVHDQDKAMEIARFWLSADDLTIMDQADADSQPVPRNSDA